MPIHYTDPSLDVPPGVDFLDADETRAWVEACEVDKPWRVPMRARFASVIGALGSGARVLELGSGPGYLAEVVLGQCSNVASYTLLDFSEHMLARSRERLHPFQAARHVQVDFKRGDWMTAVEGPFDAVIAMQAVHEIRHKRHVPGLYRQVRELLVPGGLIAICDGVPGNDPDLVRSNLYMTANEQLAALTSAGFEQACHVDSLGRVAFVTARRASSTAV